MKKYEPFDPPQVAGAIVENDHWTTTHEVERSIQIKTRVGVDVQEILEMVQSGRDLPIEFTHNHRIKEVVVFEEVKTVLVRKEKE